MTAAYRSQSTDTSIVADQLRFKLLRLRSHATRLEMASALNRSARELSLHSLQKRFAHLAKPEFARKVAQTWLHCSDFEPKGDVMTWIWDPLDLALQLHPLLEQHGGYFITGGVAATAYGEPRTTQDLDVVLNLNADTLPSLVGVLEQQGFYVPGVDDVIAGRLRTLQIIHQESVMQADLMLPETSEIASIMFARRQLLSIPNRGNLYFASPEDIVLSKLTWRKQSRSEKQWRDILGILKTQDEALDLPYLKQWASQLNLLADLEQALQESGLQTD